MANLFKEDENLEMAMIKACLLFDGVKCRKRDRLLPQKILAYLLESHSSSKELNEVIEVTKNELYALGYNEQKTKDVIDNAIKSLKDSKFITVIDNTISIQDDKLKECEEYIKEQNYLFGKLVASIYDDVHREIPNIANPTQVKLNIKSCIDYYIRISCYKALGIDEGKKIDDLDQIQIKAGANLDGDKRLQEQIILSIGNIINKPTNEQKMVLNTMAHSLIMIQLLAKDPLLANFKNTIIRQKVFILDTEFLLYVITDNGERSQKYKQLLQVLSQIGCKIYIPQEIFSEVYDHAEAANTKYQFEGYKIRNNDVEWLENGFNNVFLEAYCKLYVKENTNSWNTYIGNYYIRDYGEQYIIDVIKNELSSYKNIIFGQMPYNVNIFDSDLEDDISLRNKLYEKALAATKNTPKAENRVEYKNERIAKTDTMLYLTVRKLNLTEEKNDNYSNRSDLLKYKYYVLTKTFRIYTCLSELGINEKVFCTPDALITYLIEAGFYGEKKTDILSLFDNIFYSFIAKEYWNDTKELLQVGIVFTGQKIVRLRYDLQENVKKMLTLEPGTNEYSENIEQVKSHGYQFEKNIEYAHSLEKQIQKQKEEIEKLKSEMRHKENREKRYLSKLKTNVSPQKHSKKK